MRYRPASRRPGRNRLSLRENALELGGRDEDEEVGRSACAGDLAVAKSRVATSSEEIPAAGTRGPEVFGAGIRDPEILDEAIVSSASAVDVSVGSSEPTAAPQAEQKRLEMGTSALQAVHRGMNFSADSVTRYRQTAGTLSGGRHWPGDIGSRRRAVH